MPKDVKSSKYLRDNGTTEYRIQVDAARYAPTGNVAKLGVAAPTTGDTPRPPKGFHPRFVRVYNATYGWRNVVCYDKTATLYTGAASTIDLPVAPGSVTSATFDRKEAHGEWGRNITGDDYA